MKSNQPGNFKEKGQVGIMKITWLMLANPIFSVIVAITIVCGSFSPLPGSRPTSAVSPAPLPGSPTPESSPDQSDNPDEAALSSSHQIYLPIISQALPQVESGSWPMAGGNMQRTSWTPEEVRGKLAPVWYKPFEPFILPRTQIITAYNNLYISTANGLYALDAKSGGQKWVYPTELPLGNSPTVANGRIYVGGFDHKLHVIDAITGAGLWTFEASKGFDTNPLVVNDLVYAGNRDGNFYAIHTEGSQAGQLAWKYKTDGPIHFSAAYQDGVVYFASDDSRAYALNAFTGALIWKSAKLPGAGFHSWWPVVYRNYVIFPGSKNYRTGTKPGEDIAYTQLELEDVYPGYKTLPKGSYVGPVGEEPGDWAAGTKTIDMSRSNPGTTAVTEYFEAKPWRRTYFVLDRATGEEVTYDFDKDGKAEYAPILWLGTHSGNRYPPVVGGDGVLYQGNNYKSDSVIPGGQITGWKVDTPFISIPRDDWNAVDEPVAYIAGGNLIYWNRCCDRIGGAFDISKPNASDDQRSWNYYSYNLPSLVPGYNSNTYVTDPYYKPFGGVYGGRDGSYGWHGDVNPPIPYEGMVFMHRSNAIIAFGPDARKGVMLPQAETVRVENAGIAAKTDQDLQKELENEVQKILDAGHLRPGYMGTGLFDLRAVKSCGDRLDDYFHEPADTLYTLILALPHLPAGMQDQVKAYLKSEFDSYPPYKYSHIGWREGASRDVFDLPPEVDADRMSFGPERQVNNFEGWTFSPFSFYGLWKYAEVFGGAKEIFDAAKGNLNPVPSETVLRDMPFVQNAYIAGYMGYLELEKMAGYPESSSVRASLDGLLASRLENFTAGPPDSYFDNFKFYYCRTLNVSRNFIYLTPELAEYLRNDSATKAKIQEAVAEYTRVAPLWFVSKAEVAFGEGVINQAYDYQALFQAKAWILQEPRSELSKYLDIPSFAVGDLFYIQNLVAALEAN